MTTEQMALVKKLIQKHEIEATDAEWTLIFMGVGYGLSEQEIDSYLVMNTTDLLAKHEKMLCILVGMDSEMQGATNEIQNPAERMILSILVYTFFSRMFDLMLPPAEKHSIVAA